MASIETISYEDAEDDLKKAYDEILESRGKIAEVHKIQSLNPAALIAHMELYMATMFGKSPLRRYQREMMAVIVSATNQCDYCVNHHEQALLAYWKDTEKTALLKTNRKILDLSQQDQGLCDFAEQLTLNRRPEYSSEVEKLKQLDFSDRAILDAVQIISYFNFVNRMVMALGVEFSDQEMKGYHY